jgi:hypothetical protein
LEIHPDRRFGDAFELFGRGCGVAKPITAYFTTGCGLFRFGVSVNLAQKPLRGAIVFPGLTLGLFLCIFAQEFLGCLGIGAVDMEHHPAGRVPARWCPGPPSVL